MVKCTNCETRDEMGYTTRKMMNSMDSVSSLQMLFSDFISRMTDCQRQSKFNYKALNAGMKLLSYVVDTVDGTIAHHSNECSILNRVAELWLNLAELYKLHPEKSDYKWIRWMCYQEAASNKLANSTTCLKNASYDCEYELSWQPNSIQLLTLYYSPIEFEQKLLRKYWHRSPSEYYVILKSYSTQLHNDLQQCIPIVDVCDLVVFGYIKLGREVKI